MTATQPMIAVVVTRDGQYPLGGMEAVAECEGNAVVVDVDGLLPGALAGSLVARVREADVVVLPASPDGRDLAPRLAALLDRPLLAGAISVEPSRVTLARRGGLVIETHVVDGPYVATLMCGARGVPADLEAPAPESPSRLGLSSPPNMSSPALLRSNPVVSDPEVIEVTSPEASDLDLDEAKLILAVGAGLGQRGFVELAGRVADALGMSLGATRVVTDWGWLAFERQIGTTGVMVDPDIYVAFAISGAVQHVSGLGEPDHIVSINTDASCPMSIMAETNIVCDARAVLIAMADRLGVDVALDLREEVSSE